MSDVRSMSDAELMQLYQQGQQAQAPRKRDASDLSTWSDDELLAEQAKQQGRQANSSTLGALDNVGRILARGATMGFADEIAAVGDAALGHMFGRGSQAPSFGERYEQNLRTERGRDDALDQDYPVGSVIGQVAGGAMGAVAAPAIAPFRGASVGAKIGNSVTSGAGLGAVSGLGEGRGTEDRLKSAAIGGVAGGVLGPAIEGATHAIPAVVSRAWNAAGMGSPEKRSERLLVRALMRDGERGDLGGVWQRAARGDDQTILPDIAGRNTVGLAKLLANQPGAGAEMADRFVQARRAGMVDRLTGAVDTAFGGGVGDDIARTTAALQDVRAKAARPLYDEAFSKPAGMNEQIKAVIDDPISRAGLARGLEIQRIENTARAARGEAKIPTTDAAIQFAEDGTPRLVGVPNMRTLDAVKRGLDATIEDARDSTTGRINWTERLRAVDDLRRTYVNLLDQNNPAYAKARAAWSGPSASMDAVARGRQAFRVDRDTTKEASARIAQGDVPFYRMGAGRAVSDMLTDPARAPGNARRLVEDRNMQAKLQSVLPDPEVRANLNAALQNEANRALVDRAINPNTGAHTAQLLAGGADASGGMGEIAAGLALGAATGAPVAVAAPGMVRRLLSRTPTIDDATNSNLARMLMTPGRDALIDTVGRVGRRVQADEISQARRAMIAKLLAGGTAVGAGTGLN
ncbi:MAG: hypothetical protein AB7I42_29020 [Bradyrhizobium sp.]|uniref:hypothetical protein n=1 Tax=Bradyrhizobium sp. TaxID=376 RepID=UPI003D09CF9A